MFNKISKRMTILNKIKYVLSVKRNILFYNHIHTIMLSWLWPVAY